MRRVGAFGGTLTYSNEYGIDVDAVVRLVRVKRLRLENLETLLAHP